MFEFLFSSFRPKELTRRIRGLWPASPKAVSEDALRQEQLFSESVIDSLPGVFYLFDIDGNPLRWNRNVERVTGYSNEEIAAMHPLEFIVQEDRQKAEQRIKEVFERGHSKEELSLKAKDGRCIPLLFTGIRMKQGDRLCLAGVGIDIADRKRTEQALRQSEKALQEADRRKNEFLAMLGHELRNPLMPICTGLELLSVNNDQDAEVIALMRTQLAHLTRLVDDLLDVSRIVQGKVALRKRPAELSNIARQAVDAVRWSVDEQQQRLVVSLPDETVLVDADAVRLVQVIQNLLSNASKYTRRRGHIELTVKREEDRAFIRVRDNGIGIDGDLLPHVFDLFTQANRSLDRAQGGLGIGLTLARQLVEMHGGTIVAHSEGVDKGSEFFISLPVLSGIESIGETPESPGSLAPSSPRRILIVDDNTAAATMLHLFLSKLGEHEIAVARDGPSALELVEQHRPEVVFLDIGLPRLNGFEVASRLRARPESDQLVIVALSGYAPDSQQIVSDFDEYLVKPPSLDSVQRILARLPRAAGDRSQMPDIAMHSSSAPNVSRASQTRPPSAPPLPESLPFATDGFHGEPLSDRDRICEQADTDHCKNQFLRELAHEIGNAVLPFQMAMKIIDQDEDDASTHNYLRQVMSQQVPALIKLAANLRQVSQIVRGDLVLNRIGIDVEQVAREALQEVRPVLEQRRHELYVSLSEMPPLKADPELLRNVLIQLLENAAWYTEPGGQIALEARREGDEVVIEVRDSGMGIPRSLVPQIFRPFVRAEGSPDFHHGRFGVGLTLVRGVVERHGGTVQVDSAGGNKGSRFVVRLPHGRVFRGVKDLQQ